MRHRVAIDTEEVVILVDALERRRDNILDEMLAEHVDRDELVGAVDALRQVDRQVKRWNKVLWAANIQKADQEEAEND